MRKWEDKQQQRCQTLSTYINVDISFGFPFFNIQVSCLLLQKGLDGNNAEEKTNKVEFVLLNVIVHFWGPVACRQVSSKSNNHSLKTKSNIAGI